MEYIKKKMLIRLLIIPKILKKQVIVLNINNQNKDIEINKLSKENDTFKNNKQLIKRNELLKEQKQEINRLNVVIDILNNQIENLQANLINSKRKYITYAIKFAEL